MRCRPTRAATCPQCPARWGSLTASSCAPAGSEGRAGERPCCLLGVGAPVETEASPVLGSPPSFPAPGCLVTAACGQQPGRTRFQSRPPWATCAGAPPLASWPHRESERAGAGVVHGLARSGGSEPAYAALPGALERVTAGLASPVAALGGLGGHSVPGRDPPGDEAGRACHSPAWVGPTLQHLLGHRALLSHERTEPRHPGRAPVAGTSAPCTWGPPRLLPPRAQPWALFLPVSWLSR